MTAENGTWSTDRGSPVDEPHVDDEDRVRTCLLFGSADEPTTGHIIPQAWSSSLAREGLATRALSRTYTSYRGLLWLSAPVGATLTWR